MRAGINSFGSVLRHRLYLVLAAVVIVAGCDGSGESGDVTLTGRVVDAETGDAIIRTIRSMTEDRTVIIVSHRLSAVRFADIIITLAEGRISESGSHEVMMSEDGYYARMFRLQEIEEEMNVF